MYFQDYRIPKNITPEDEFMYELVSKLDAIGSARGFVIGEFYRLIDIMKENKVPEDDIKPFSDLLKTFERVLDEYDDILQFAAARWEELGKPLSLKAHQAKKKQIAKKISEYDDR